MIGPGGSTLRDWLIGLTFGAIGGAVILGVGGRLAMRALAIMQEWTPYFTVYGTATIVAFGGAAGAGFAVVLLTLRSVPRLPSWSVPLFYWLALAAVTLHLLQPIDRDRLTVFPPLVFLFGVAQQLGFARLLPRRPGPC